MSTESHPRQQVQWDACMARLNDGNMPHALLLHGEVGVGLRHFADRLASALLCPRDDKPCGDCHACRLHSGGNHPDFCLVAAEKEEGEIKVGQIRDLLSFLQISRHYEALKTVLIRDADMMNRVAANSLLKMLEEPPAGVILLLTSHHPFRLPATVRSRCQSVRLNRSEPQVGAGTLDGDEAPGREAFRKDVANLLRGQTGLAGLAEKWQDQPVRNVHQWLLEITEETIRREFEGAGRGFPLRKLFSFYDRQKYRCLSLKVRLNPRLLLESALIEWQLVCVAAKQSVRGDER